MKKIIFINFFIIIFFIIFLELTLNFFKLSGLMGIQSGLIGTKNESHFMIPNSNGIIFGEKVYIDKNGFRVPKKNFKYKNNKNIYIIGDSTTFGNGVLEENTFVGLLRNEFTEVNFLNSAAPGYQIKNHINNLNKIKDFDNIDKIFYFFTLNDVLNSTNIVDKKDKRKKSSEGSFKLKEIKLINYINTYLRNKSYLYMYIKGIVTDPSKRWYSNIDKFYKNNDINFLTNDFNSLINFSNKINADLFIVILPYEYQTRKCDLNYLIPQKKINEILSNLKVNYFDFTKNFCKLNNPRNHFYKFDPMHLSKKGHKLVYNLIINEISF